MSEVNCDRAEYGFLRGVRDGECKIILVRHGESLANAVGIYLGHTDWDLSTLGKEQAVACADRLRRLSIDKIYSSDLLRAYHTALPHAKMRDLEVLRDVRLREIYLGEWEGRKVTDLESKWQTEFCIGWRLNFGTCTPPSGESVQSAGWRIYERVLEIGRENVGKTVLVASHAAAIRSFYGRVAKIPQEQLAARLPFPTNASCTTVIYRGGSLFPVAYGE